MACQRDLSRRYVRIRRQGPKTLDSLLCRSSVVTIDSSPDARCTMRCCGVVALSQPCAMNLGGVRMVDCVRRGLNGVKHFCDIDDISNLRIPVIPALSAE